LLPNTTPAISKLQNNNLQTSTFKTLSFGLPNVLQLEHNATTFGLLLAIFENGNIPS
jgi:hypothetical protein